MLEFGRCVGWTLTVLTRPFSERFLGTFRSRQRHLGNLSIEGYTLDSARCGIVSELSYWGRNRLLRRSSSNCTRRSGRDWYCTQNTFELDPQCLPF